MLKNILLELIDIIKTNFIVILTMIVVLGVFIFGLYTISENNKCTGVRVYNCDK